MASAAALLLAGVLRIAWSGEDPAVGLAANDLAADCGKVLGAPAQVVTGGRADIVLALDRSLEGQEAWRITIAPTGVTIVGSDRLGLVYGVYQFSERCLGVDPLWFWKSIAPERRTRVELSAQVIVSTPAKFRYRGWFINDEDLLTDFGTSAGPRNIDYPHYAQVIDPRMAERIYEALLRLGGNLIIPASFCDVFNPPEAELVRRAVARGLYVSQHHVEPMGVSHFSFEKFWRTRGETKAFRYATDPDAVRTVWRAYAEKWHQLAGDQVIWQLGMRGRGDRPIWVDDKAITRSTGGAFISNAMADQWAIVRSVDPRPMPVASTTLFLEGAELMAAGELKLPPGITVVFSDRGETQELQDDFRTCPRLPAYRYGVYYHAAFWRRGPHLVPGIAPERIPDTLAQLEARGDTAYAIVNVSNVREHVLGAQVFIRTAVNGATWGKAQALSDFAPPSVHPLLKAYYAALARRPDGAWLQDGVCVEVVDNFIKEAATSRAAAVAAARRYVDPQAAEASALRLEAFADTADLTTVAGPWRNWCKLQCIVQARYQAALYRAVASLARNDSAAAAEQVAKSLELRAPLASGEWVGWYAGDKKANWPALLARLRALPKGS